MPKAHTSDIIAPSLVGGSEHIAEGLWLFPNYPHTLTMNKLAIKSCPIGVGECFMSLTM